jgi:uncharacterized protein (TIGR02001 family)
VTAAARPRGSQALGSTSRRVLKILLATLCLSFAAPAAAEVGASAALFSEASFRGYSLSAGRPVAVLNLSYDHPSGAYGATSAGAVLGSDELVEPLSLQLNGGYAKRLPTGIVVDFGLTHSNHSRYASRGSGSYTEIYAGISRKVVSARIGYAPHYFVSGYSTIYGEVDANFSPMPKLNLNAHVGLLVPLDYPAEFGARRIQRDWRIGAARQVGPLSLHAFLTGGGPGRDFYGGRSHSRTRLVLGLSYPL